MAKLMMIPRFLRALSPGVLEVADTPVRGRVPGQCEPGGHDGCISVRGVAMGDGGSTTRAIGLVHRPGGTPSADRSWSRALVIRRARDCRLELLDVFELDDDDARTGDVLRRLTDLATTSGPRVLVTDGVRPDLAAQLARHLGLRHLPVRPSACGTPDETPSAAP